MKKLLITLCLAAALLAGGMQLTTVNASAKTNPAKAADIHTLERAAITIMEPGIKSAINTFYGQYLKQLPEINVTDTKITDVTAYNGAVFFDVTVETKPFFEANVPVGQDRISLFVNVYGQVIAEKFEHLRNFELPANYRDRIIKLLPENTVTNLTPRTHGNSDIEATPDTSLTAAQKLDALVRVLVISEVQNAINVFYAPYLSFPQINAYFGYKIAGLSENKDDSGAFTLAVTITPYVGAHNLIGKEKITMNIWNGGVVFVMDYEHLINYGIVPWLKDMLKKPLPEGTQKDA